LSRRSAARVCRYKSEEVADAHRADSLPSVKRLHRCVTEAPASSRRNTYRCLRLSSWISHDSSSSLLTLCSPLWPIGALGALAASSAESGALLPFKLPEAKRSYGATKGTAGARVSNTEARGLLLLRTPSAREGNWSELLRDAAERSEKSKIGGGVIHNGIGWPVTIPGGFPGSVDGAGRFGLRGVVPAAVAVQLPKPARLR